MVKYLLHSAKYTHANFLIKLTLQNYNDIPRDSNGETKAQNKSKTTSKEALITICLHMKLLQLQTFVFNKPPQKYY